MEARSGRVTLSTQNGGSYARMRVTRIDVAIDDREDIEQRGHIRRRDDHATRRNGAGAETELDPIPD